MEETRYTFARRKQTLKWLNDTPTSEVLKAATLDELRSQLPAGVHRIPRAASDEPQIVETWI